MNNEPPKTASCNSRLRPLLCSTHIIPSLKSMTSRPRTAGYRAARKLSRLPTMILGSDNSNGRKSGPSNVLIRSKGLTAIIAIGLCSIGYLTWFLPAVAVRTRLGRLFPSIVVTTEAHSHWNSNPRRLIVFGDSWSDDGQYPVDPLPRDQVPSREEAQGKVWTEWLCSAVSAYEIRRPRMTS